MSYYYLIKKETLTDIAEAIREKRNYTYCPRGREFAEEIRGIVGGIDTSVLSFGSDCDYLFSQNTGFNALFKKYGSELIFNKVSSAYHMFYNAFYTDLSTLNIDFYEAWLKSCFESCFELEKLPKVSGSYCDLDKLFSGCHVLPSSEINEFFKNLSYVERSGFYGYMTRAFEDCYVARSLGEANEYIHTSLNKNTVTNFSYSLVNTYTRCYMLDALDNIPVLYNTAKTCTSNVFSGAFSQCHRAKDLIFKTNNGTPYTVQWSGQTIDAHYNLGYGNYEDLTKHGASTEKKVVDDTTYQALKNDVDWWTLDINYSRYNHDSAVRTINSLPDTSAFLATKGGTNTIKFKGGAGALTDGGAINTLTEEEIAVAAAKGWTVALS